MHWVTRPVMSKERVYQRLTLSPNSWGNITKFYQDLKLHGTWNMRWHSCHVTVSSWVCMYSLPMLPPLLFFTDCTRPLCQNMGVTSINYLRMQKYRIFWYIVTTYLWGGPSSTCCFSSKFHHLSPEQPSNSLPFLITNWTQNTLSELKFNMPA